MTATIFSKRAVYLTHTHTQKKKKKANSMAKPLENKGKKGEFRRVALRFMTIRKPSAKQRGNISCRAENFRREFSGSRQTAEPDSRGLPVLNKRTAGIARTAGLPDNSAGQSCRQTVFQQPGESRSSKPDKRPKRRRKPVRTEPAKHAGQTRFRKQVPTCPKQKQAPPKHSPNRSPQHCFARHCFPPPRRSRTRLSRP